MAIVVVGALLFVGGVLFLAGTAIFRGRFSKPHGRAAGAGSLTLEPERRGLSFLGIATNWPGLLMIFAGAMMLLWSAAG